MNANKIPLYTINDSDDYIPINGVAKSIIEKKKQDEEAFQAEKTQSEGYFEREQINGQIAVDLLSATIDNYWQKKIQTMEAIRRRLDELQYGTLPMRFEKTTVTESPKNLRNGLLMQEKLHYSDGEYIGLVYKLTNKTDHMIHIKKEDIPDSHQGYINISSDTVPPQGVVWYYIWKERT